MFIKNEHLASLVKSVLETEGVHNADSLTQKVIDRLTSWQRSTALQGSEKAGHPKKKINWSVVKKQLDAGVDMTTIAASQHVSESTLRRRIKEEDISSTHPPHQPTYIEKKNEIN